MLSHLFPGTARSAVTDTLQALFRFGASGVDLFFVLSGFLITGILYDSLHDRAYFRKFYARRALRIFPLYYGVLAIFLLQKIILGYHFHRELLSLALYLQNTHLIAAPIYDYTGAAKLPLVHFWSLSIEEQFYLVWPLLVFLIRDRRRLLAVCLAALALCPALRAFLVLHGAPYFMVHTNTVYRADSLLAGAALALLLRGPAHDRVLKHAGKLLLASIIPVVLVCFVPLLLSQAAYAARLQNLTRIFGYSLMLLLYSSLLAKVVISECDLQQSGAALDWQVQLRHLCLSRDPLRLSAGAVATVDRAAYYGEQGRGRLSLRHVCAGIIAGNGLSVVSLL